MDAWSVLWVFSLIITFSTKKNGKRKANLQNHEAGCYYQLCDLIINFQFFYGKIVNFFEFVNFLKESTKKAISEFDTDPTAYGAGITKEIYRFRNNLLSFNIT